MVIYVELDEKNRIESWGSSPISDDCISVSIDDDHPLLEGDVLFKYTVKDGRVEKLLNSQQEVLNIFKDEKKQALSQSCQDDILNGFEVEIDGEEYHFSYDREAQSNLQERWQLFQNNMVEEMNITAHLGEEDTRLTVDKEVFSTIYMQSVMAKENKIKKLREDLFPLVERAKSQSELDVIKWDMEVIEPKPESIILKDDKTLDKELDRVESDSAVANNEIINLIMLTNMMGGMG